MPNGSSELALPAHLRVGCGLALGLTLAIPATAAIAQPDELQQLEDFLAPPPTQPPQFQPPQAAPPQPLHFAPSPPAPALSPPIPAVVSPPASGQPQLRRLSLNSHNPGTLGSPRQLQEGFYQDRFQFEGQSGELILLNLIGSDDPRMQLDPLLQLIGPDGSLVAEDDNSGYDSARGDARIVLSLPDTGSYTIVVTTAKPDDRGRYTLGLLEVDDPSIIQ
ncbi:MAG: PPC domain-containing protein [Cyanobacteria bacterium J06597_1]